MSAEPEQANRKYMHPDSEEAKAKIAAVERHAASVERSEWLQFWRIYERCVDIAHKVWDAKIEDATAQQRELAKSMRDRLHPYIPGPGMGERVDAGIPVPLFTPRDRLQFLKEVSAHLNIEAGHRGLHIRFPKDWVAHAPTQPEGDSPAGPEGSSDTPEEALDAEARELSGSDA